MYINLEALLLVGEVEAQLGLKARKVVEVRDSDARPVRLADNYKIII